MNCQKRNVVESAYRNRDAQQLFADISEWKPKFERAVELAAAEVYAALRKGRLTSKGVRLPDPDVAVSLKLLTEQNKKVGGLDAVPIGNEFWSLQSIYWEISAARNETEHYCHILCPTDDVMSIFPVNAVTTGEPVDGLVRHGSFFVLSPTSTTAAAPARRSQGRNRGGRPPEYRWNDLHVEMAELVSKRLPAKKDSVVAHLREVYRKRFGDPVPGHRTLYNWVKPYYERFCGNSDS